MTNYYSQLENHDDYGDLSKHFDKLLIITSFDSNSTGFTMGLQLFYVIVYTSDENNGHSHYYTPSPKQIIEEYSIIFRKLRDGTSHILIYRFETLQQRLRPLVTTYSQPELNNLNQKRILQDDPTFLGKFIELCEDLDSQFVVNQITLTKLFVKELIKAESVITCLFIMMKSLFPDDFVPHSRGTYFPRP